MAHRTRGYTSHTYDIRKVLSVDYATLSIRFTDAAHASPRAVRLDVDAQLPVAAQLLEAVAESIAVFGDGQWESSETISNAVGWVQRVVRTLAAGGIDDLADEAVDLPLLRQVLEPFPASAKRTLNKLVGRALRSSHPDGDALARALQNTRYMVSDPTEAPYDDEEVDAIQRAARGVFDEAFKSQRDQLRILGYDTSDRSWLRISAEEILDDVRRRHGALEGSRQPSFSAPREVQLAWALLNPASFGRSVGRPPLLGAALPVIGRALYPPAAVLSAAAILHCLAELSGLNLSTILRTEPSHLSYTGSEHAIVDLAKARNHSEDRIPVHTGSNNTLGGMIEALTGLTRFSRHWRAVHLDTDGQKPEIVDRLYVEHVSDPLRAEVITNQRLHYGFRQEPFERHWPPGAPKAGLRFRSLRRKALERAVAANPGADVHGHTERTRVHYLANVLPDHVLTAHAAAAQDAILSAALAKFSSVDSLPDERARRLSAAVAEGRSADVVVSVCTSGGNDPDRDDRPCSLGLAACFTCPNGFRTVDHIPGLLATLEYTALVRDNNPDEWENGDASSLHFYAQESLRQFPTTVVDEVRSAIDLAPLVTTIDVLYTEFRR
jgi:hypothetical protein